MELIVVLKLFLVLALIVIFGLVCGKYRVWTFIKKYPPLALYLLVLLGFMFSPGENIMIQLMENFGNTFVSMGIGKVMRITTVIVAGIIALLMLSTNKILDKCFKGCMGLFFLYFVASTISGLFSKIPLSSLFKSF